MNINKLLQILIIFFLVIFIINSSLYIYILNGEKEDPTLQTQQTIVDLESDTTENNSSIPSNTTETTEQSIFVETTYSEEDDEDEEEEDEQDSNQSEEESTENPPLCLTNYNLTPYTIIFYYQDGPYSNAMKPIVQELETLYNFYWTTELWNRDFNSCFGLTGSTPAFVCAGTKEKIVGELSKEQLADFASRC